MTRNVYFTAFSAIPGVTLALSYNDTYNLKILLCNNSSSLTIPYSIKCNLSKIVING